MIADELLDGPRGRHLCHRFAGSGPAHGDLFLSLREAVDSARYWQEPDDIDVSLAADPEPLRPVAETVVAGAPDWWSAPVDLDGQVLTVFDRRDDPPLAGTAGVLAEWLRAEDRAAAQLAEYLAQAPDPDWAWRHFSGRWWSAPLVPSVPGTTRCAPDPVGLRLVEDFGGFSAAEVRPVVPTRAVRVHEVHGPADWAALVERFPLEVGESRGPDWWQVTGRVGRWLIPDWPRVAAEFDAVHVSVRGYLSTAGRVVPIGDDAATLLTGWSPDVTHWLTDVLAVGGPSQRWTADDDDGWSLS